MDKNLFKDLLFELLNEFGEQVIGLVDIMTYDKEDRFVVVLPGGQKFEICIRQLTQNDSILKKRHCFPD